MKIQQILQLMLITIYCGRRTQGQGSCVAAGYIDCCRDYIDAPNGTIFSSFACQDPMNGRCFCDFACHFYLDCCEDIDRICPNSTCANAGYTSCCTNGTCKTNEGCYCDSHCHSVGDCCPDISETCPRNTMSSDRNETRQLSSRPQLIYITTDMQLPASTEESEKISVRELTSWILVALLFSMLITIITVTTIKVICKRKIPGSSEDQAETMQDCKMEGNPCYETVTFSQVTTRAQAHTQDYRYLQ